MIHRRTLLAAPIALAAAAQPAAAQPGAAWPAGRPIRLVVGFPPGGSGDFLARTLSEPLARELGGATIIVDNRPGAGSNIAAEHVARSEPDGYTILLGGNFTHAVNPAMYRRLPFDPINDFTPITRVSDLPLIIAVRADAGINNLADLAARMRAQPGRWNYATPGIGTPSHLVGAKLAKVTGQDITHVPFRGGAPSLQAVLAGDVQILVGTPPVALPQIRAGTLKALSLSTRLPSPVIPDVPGSEVAGLPGTSGSETGCSAPSAPYWRNRLCKRASPRKGCKRYPAKARQNLAVSCRRKCRFGPRLSGTPAPRRSEAPITPINPMSAR
jgi:tripartite-type tricarboxylate transporter receptor subunit TctC